MGQLQATWLWLGSAACVRRHEGLPAYICNWCQACIAAYATCAGTASRHMPAQQSDSVLAWAHLPTDSSARVLFDEIAYGCLPYVTLQVPSMARASTPPFLRVLSHLDGHTWAYVLLSKLIDQGRLSGSSGPHLQPVVQAVSGRDTERGPGQYLWQQGNGQQLWQNCQNTFQTPNLCRYDRGRQRCVLCSCMVCCMHCQKNRAMRTPW